MINFFWGDTMATTQEFEVLLDHTEKAVAKVEEKYKGSMTKAEEAELLAKYQAAVARLEVLGG